MLILNTDLLYDIVMACLACSVISFTIMLFIRYSGRRHKGASGKKAAHQRKRPVLRFILNVGAQLPLSIVAVLLLWIWVSLWRINGHATVETDIQILAACATLYAIFLMGIVTLIRFLGRNKSAKGSENRSHPLLRIVLDVAAWVPVSVIFVFVVSLISQE